MEDTLTLPLGTGQRSAEAFPSFNAAVTHYELMPLTLGGHAYGVPHNCIVDVREPQAPVRYFNRPACMVGSLWIAGEHAPVIDLRLALGLKPERGSRHPVLAIDIGECVVGVVVDAIGDVLALRADTVSPADATSGPIEPRHLFGQSRDPRGHPITLLDMVGWVQHLNDLFELTSA